MNDVKFCLGLVVTVLSTYFNRDNELETYLEKYNEEFPHSERLRNEIDEVLTFIDRLNFETSSRAFKKADFYTLFVELYWAKIKSSIAIDVGKLRTNLDSFYRQVELASQNLPINDDQALEYYKAALQASNDRSSRILRGNVISEIIHKSQCD